MNPFTNLPPGCRDSDIPGNHPDTYTYCKGCEREFNTDDLEDDGSGFCEDCAKVEQISRDAAHVDWVKASGKVWCQRAGQWLHPDGICQCGNSLDIKDHSRCSACEQDRADFERDCQRDTQALRSLQVPPSSTPAP